MQSYASLQDGVEQEESGVLIHVVETSRARWNHIEDLDSFFSNMYRYHQQHGFRCMLLKEILELIQFIFVVYLTTFFIYCIDYPVLYRNQPINSTKITMPDFIYSGPVCRSRFSLITWCLLVIAALVWLWKFLRSVYTMFHFWEIKQFYNCALAIPDGELDNLTWNEVQNRVRQVQKEQQMCIHKKELSELDIYHRILRQQNYLVAMVNKRLLPPRFHVPFIGDVVYWTPGLRYNMKFLLFWGPRAPFENPWHLREDFRKQNMRFALARQLGHTILMLALANLALAPLIFLWQVLYAFFSYADVVRREPGSLGVRNWSLYGRMYLRHFNELEHELQARLNRARRPSARYVTGFNSPITGTVARSFAFMLGAILAVLVVLSVYDEDVLAVEHMLTLLTCLGGGVAICRSLIPDETVAWLPEMLLASVLAHTHYLPAGWKGRAHTAQICAEFQQLFQYRVVALLEELVSPLLTPFVLWWYVYPRALDLVDFYRNFTVSVVGVGDVCSFAQLDVRKHGNPEWQGAESVVAPDQYTQAEDGKTELSLVHFKMTNPAWQPPPGADAFVEAVARESSLVGNEGGGGRGGDFWSRADLTASASYGSLSHHEGPPSTNPQDMSMSALYLYDRHYRQTGGRVRRAEETTPLLAN